MSTYTVYRHTAPNGKMYVGITKMRPKRRWDCGRGYKENEYFSHAIAKYGWDNFKHEILLEGLTVDEASLAEKIFIGYWDLTNRNKGYNLESGGVANWEITEETRRKISEAQIGRKASDETKRKMSEAQKKVWEDEDYREYMSQLRKGRVFSDKHKNNLSIANNYRKRPVLQIDKDSGEIINYFDCMISAAKYLSLPNPRKHHIGDCCSGERSIAYGFRWEYANGGEIA